MRSLCLPILLTVLCLLTASGTSVLAHHGADHPAWEVDEFEDEAFMTGLAHPFTGVDHLVAMLAVGALAGMARRRLAVAVTGVIGLGIWHAGAIPGLPFGIGLYLGTAAGVWLSMAAACWLMTLPAVKTHLAKVTE